MSMPTQEEVQNALNVLYRVAETKNVEFTINIRNPGAGWGVETYMDGRGVSFARIKNSGDFGARKIIEQDLKVLHR